MALRRVTWDIMQTSGPSLPVILIVHIETEIKPIFISIQSICGLDVSSVHALRCSTSLHNGVLLLDMSRQFVNYICSTWCNCSSLVAFYGDDANTPVRCANCTEAFLGDISHLAPISSSFSSVCMYLLHVLVMSKMKPIRGWYIVFQCETGTSGNFV